MPNLFIASGIFHPESGGPATYLHEILPHLQARGWEVRLLTFADHADMGGSYPYPVTRIPRTSLISRMRAYASAARSLMRWGDVTYLHTLGLPLIGGGSPRVVKIVGDVAWERAVRKGWITPTTDIDDFQAQRYSLQAEIGKFTRAREARRMDAIIVPSEYLGRMVAGWGVDPSKIHVIYNAMPPIASHQAGEALSQHEARRRLTLPDAPTILTVGRILPWKGVDHLITAVSRLSDVRLIVAGDGDRLDSLKAMAGQLRVADRVAFTGKISREQVDLYMRAADYTALYSGYEGLSHTLLESLRAGTPCIASDKGGNPEVIRQRENGLLVPYVNVDALTEAIREAFTPGLRDRLAANATIGMERFEYGRMVESTDAVLRSML
ncbi:MAG: glycosyltransferase family 4 protein [Anaerolineae bacterium]